MIKAILDYIYLIFENLSYTVSFLSRIYLKYHEYSVRKEIALLKLSSDEKILHIGCGIIPYTSIILSNYVDSKILGIDNNDKTVEKSKKYLKKTGLEGSIQVEKGDGIEYDVSGFDIVILSYGVTHNEKILQNVINKIDKNKKILLRLSSTEKNEDITSKIKKYYIDHKKSLLTQNSYLLIKK